MASTNIFDLLNDDAQDQEIQIPVVKKEVKPVAAKPAAAATKATDNKAPRKDGARSGKPRDGGDDRAPRGPRFDRTPRDGANVRAPRGPRAPRGGRHGGYDRHSGTGIVDSEKKENNRLGDATTAPLEGEKDAQLTAEVTGAATPEPVEPEVVVKTLDDYLQEKANKALKLSLPEARAANAGADNSQWKDTKVLEVEETGDFIKMSKETTIKSRKTKKETKVLITDIEVRYTEPAREQSAPRGAFRGGNNASAPRRAAAARVNVDDTELFPSLGSK
ncbi:hypothetical protein BG011_007325 [Mortierella polycephala]|uniref:Hyaluronan/mRNA-binding protein domain-containing protein n=1 Tax=Mortierella polycephala TaxID=41804 RepID=A0A9P6QCD3_9FUNG|nr:hypothetical protein BG011_007325 [Mortierella polycephala]